MARMNQDISVEIVRNIAILKEQPSGWTLECNLVRWNGDEPKIDIRTWSPDHSKCGKGVALTVEEMQTTIQALHDLQIMEV